MKKVKKEELEKGSASILIDLTNSIISVKHGTNKTELYKKVALEGDWDKIWKAIKGEK